MPATFTVYGNHGELTVCAYTGLVLAYEPQEDGDYFDAFRFDLPEYRATYPGASLPGAMVDILAIGFWAVGERAGYVGAESDYRAWEAGEPSPMAA